VWLVVWVLVASLLNRVLRLALEGYAAAEPQMVFTHGMMAARLALGALASLAAGAATRAVAPSSARVVLVLGGVLLAAFVPIHVQLWARFPVWYHLVFLGTLIPLVVLTDHGSKTKIGRSRRFRLAHAAQCVNGLE